MTQASPLAGLRIATFNVLPQMYTLISRWAEMAGAKIVLVVTTPGPSTRPTPSFRDVALNAAADKREVLVTTRLRTVAAPLLRELRPDIILSASFPYRLPPEVLTTPKIAAVNMHPTPLPYYRGPNPLRLMYDGFPEMGATLHYTDADFDTGDILARYTAPLPDPLTAEAIFSVWPPLMLRTLMEGMTKAVARVPGTKQDDSKATYAAQFGEEDRWLDWNEPARAVQRKAVALNLFGNTSARARIDGVAYAIPKAEWLRADTRTAPPGTVLDREGEMLTLATGDGVIRVSAVPSSGEATDN